MLFVGREGVAIGMITVADPIKPNAAEAVRALRGLGVDSIMITGDAERTARAVAGAIDIGDLRAGVLPCLLYTSRCV